MVFCRRQTFLLPVPSWVVFSFAFLPSVLGTPLAAQTASSEDMVIYLEAENTTSRSESSLSRWVNVSSIAGFSGSGYVQLTTKPQSAGDEVAKLKYVVNFPEAGEYAIFFRGYVKKGREILIKADIDGSPALYKRDPRVHVYSGYGTTPPTLTELSDPGSLARKQLSSISASIFEQWSWHSSIYGSGGSSRMYLWEIGRAHV